MATTNEIMEKTTAQARETATSTTADGGVSYSYSCGYATIDRTESMIEKAGGRAMDELHFWGGVLLAEKHREDDAKQQRYLAKQQAQVERAKKIRVQTQAQVEIKKADAEIAKANADAKKAEAEIANANAKMKELELRERDIAIREKELNIQAKAETAVMTIEKKHKKVEDDGELY